MLVDGVENHLFNDRFAEGLQLLTAAERTFDCAAPPTRDQLGRFWLARGTLEYLQNHKNEAIESFAAANTLHPELWVDNYGTRMRRVYDDAAVGVSGEGTVNIAADLEAGLTAYLDGQAVSFPATTRAGLHLIQVFEDGRSIWHQLVVVPEDAEAVFEFVRPEPPPEPSKKKKKPKVGDYQLPG